MNTDYSDNSCECNNNLMDILLTNDADHETLSPAVPLDACAFGWQDFPLVAHSLQQQDDETDSIIIVNHHHEPLNELHKVKIVPSPALSFDSFAWGDFPVVVNKKTAPLEDETTVSTAVFSSESSLRSTNTEEWEEEGMMIGMDHQEQVAARRHLEATCPILFL